MKFIVMVNVEFLCFSFISLMERKRLQLIYGFGVAKVLESAHSGFSEGDLVWGILKWEEYSVVEEPGKLIKIQHTDVPLSYYTGILGIISV